MIYSEVAKYIGKEGLIPWIKGDEKMLVRVKVEDVKVAFGKTFFWATSPEGGGHWIQDSKLSPLNGQVLA